MLPTGKAFEVLYLTPIGLSNVGVAVGLMLTLFVPGAHTPPVEALLVVIPVNVGPLAI